MPPGRRFELFYSRSFGDDLIEHDDFTIVEDRYIGALRHFEGGVSESRTAATYDTFTRTKLRNSDPCDSVDTGDFSGVEDAAFLPRGGLAYACGRLRISDRLGDRQLEPPGTDVRQLAVSMNTRGFGLAPVLGHRDRRRGDREVARPRLLSVASGYGRRVSASKYLGIYLNDHLAGATAPSSSSAGRARASPRAASSATS